MLGKVYAVLADKDQRAVFDEQGIVDEESESLDQDRNWEEHWRRLFPKVFLTLYAGSLYAFIKANQLIQHCYDFLGRSHYKTSWILRSSIKALMRRWRT